MAQRIIINLVSGEVLVEAGQLPPVPIGVSPSVFAGTATFLAPTVETIPGEATVFPSTFGGTSTFPAPTVAADPNIVAVVFVGAATFPAPTVAGNADIAATAFTPTATFLTPAVNQNAAVPAVAFTGTVTFPAPTVEAGEATVFPTTFAGTAVFATITQINSYHHAWVFTGPATFPTPSVFAGIGVEVGAAERFVTATGSGSADGKSWATATTLQHAHDTLPASGGVIHIAGGAIPCDNVVWTKPVTADGAGKGATELTVAATSQRGLRLLGDGAGGGASMSTLRDIGFRGALSSTAISWLLDIDSADHVLLDNTQFWNVGWNRIAAPTEPTPTAIRFSNTQGGGSKHTRMRTITMRNVYRGFDAINGSSGLIDNASLIGCKYGYFRTNSKYWHLWGFHWPASSAAADSICIEFFGSAEFCTIDGGQIEAGAGPPASDTDLIWFRDNAKNIIVETFNFRGDEGGGINQTRLQDAADYIYVGLYTKLGSGATFANVSSGTHNKIWQAADYTGSFS